jgi:hypothetical protein
MKLFLSKDSTGAVPVPKGEAPSLKASRGWKDADPK